MRALDDQNFATGKPTEKAYSMADSAAQYAFQAETKAANQSYDKAMASAVGQLAAAVSHLAVGLRATYLMLEKIERSQRKQP